MWHSPKLVRGKHGITGPTKLINHPYRQQVHPNTDCRHDHGVGESEVILRQPFIFPHCKEEHLSKN